MVFRLSPPIAFDALAMTVLASCAATTQQSEATRPTAASDFFNIRAPLFIRPERDDLVQDASTPGNAARRPNANSANLIVPHADSERARHPAGRDRGHARRDLRQ